MAEKRVDRRIKRTQKLIKEGFVELLLKKPVQDIRVQELSDLIDINRGTFYQHYKDIYDLLECIEDEIINEFKDLLNNTAEKAVLNGDVDADHLVSMMIKEILIYIKDNEKTITALFAENGDQQFMYKLKKLLKNGILKQKIGSLRHSDMQYFDYYFEYICSGSVEVMRLWVRKGMKESVDDITNILEGILMHGAQMFA